MVEGHSEASYTEENLELLLEFVEKECGSMLMMEDVCIISKIIYPRLSFLSVKRA